MNAQTRNLPETVTMTTTNEFLAMAKTCFEERPEDTDAEVLKTLQSVFDPMPTDAAAQVLTAREELFSMWHTHYATKTNEEHASMAKARSDWLFRRVYEAYRAGGVEGIPTYDTLRGDQKRIFGTCSNDLTAIRHAAMDAVDNEESVEPWYIERGYSEESVKAEVADGLAFYEQLTDTQVAALHAWTVENQSNPAKPPNTEVKSIIRDLDGRQLMFGTVMRLCGVALTQATMRRCYSGYTGRGFGTYVRRIVEEELSLSEQDNTVLHMRATGHIEQAVNPVEEVVEEVVEEEVATTPVEEVVEEKVETTTRMHPDDRAVLVAELRAAITSDNAERDRQLSQLAKDIGEIKGGLVKMVAGIEKLGDAMVTAQRQTEGQPTVRLDAESMQTLKKLHGMEQRIVDGLGELKAARSVEVPLTAMSGGGGGGEESSSISDLIRAGRGFSLTVDPKPTD